MQESERPGFHKGLGDYLKHPPVRAFCDLSADVWSLYHKAIGGHERVGESPRQHLMSRMIYTSESTSAAIKLAVTWALSMPGMSLVRDRFEQVVRHSWLLHQPDTEELSKYVGRAYIKQNKVITNLDPAVRKILDEEGFKFEAWQTEKPTKKEKEEIRRWEDLDLASMVAKRDALLNDEVPEKKWRALSSFYTPIYRQFSSISHFDMYSMRFLGLHKAPEGPLVLAPDPWWPATLMSYTALFDLIQCSEATKLVHKLDRSSDWQALFDKWKGYSERMVGKGEKPDQDQSSDPTSTPAG
jgi:hypothetical protein